MRSTVPEQCRAWGHDRLSSLPGLCSSDILRYLTKSEANRAGGNDFKHRLSAFATPELLALTAHRLAHYFYVKGWRRLARGLTWWNRLVHRITIEPASCIGPGLHIPHPATIYFAASAGRQLTLYPHAICCAHPPGSSEWRLGNPSLGDHVTVGANSSVLGPVRIGDGARIAFSQRVVDDVPPGSMVVSSAIRVTHQRGVARA
jgi:serine O-acetyltransferase